MASHLCVTSRFSDGRLLNDLHSGHVFGAEMLKSDKSFSSCGWDGVAAGTSSIG